MPPQRTVSFPAKLPALKFTNEMSGAVLVTAAAAPHVPPCNGLPYRVVVVLPTMQDTSVALSDRFQTPTQSICHSKSSVSSPGQPEGPTNIAPEANVMVAALLATTVAFIQFVSVPFEFSMNA